MAVDASYWGSENSGMNTLIANTCSWNAPGTNPYTGRIGDAVWRLSLVPAYTRERLIDEVQWTLPTDRVWITRDRIWGRYEYAGLRDMHFGKGTLCRWVDNSGWHWDRREEASVWCTSGTCVIIPRICGNVAQVTKIGWAIPPPASRTLRALPVRFTERLPYIERLSLPGGLVRKETRPEEPIPDEPTHTVPEPSTLALVLCAAMIVVVARTLRRGK